MIYVIMPGKPSKQLMNMVTAAIENIPTVIINDENKLPDLTNKRILFAIEIDEHGFNIPLYKILSSLSKRGSRALVKSTAALIIHSQSDLYTKSIAKSVIFTCNQLGCHFIGHSLVEVTKSLNNFLTWQKKYQLSLEEISLILSKKLIQRLIHYSPQIIINPNILTLHSSSKYTSNTLMLWNMVKKNLINSQIEELHVENGTVLDCIGCPYQTCKHYGLRNSCYYGGVMIQEIHPAIEKADAIIWICPNYNDSISANLMAVINRLTALYRKINFYDKNIFAVIVSGNSGGNTVAEQLINALNINKGFNLPPYFAIMETANDPKSILKVDGIEDKALMFAKNIMAEIKKNTFVS